MYIFHVMTSLFYLRQQFFQLTSYKFLEIWCDVTGDATGDPENGPKIIFVSFRILILGTLTKVHGEKFVFHRFIAPGVVSTPIGGKYLRVTSQVDHVTGGGGLQNVIFVFFRIPN